MRRILSLVPAFASLVIAAVAGAATLGTLTAQRLDAFQGSGGSGARTVYASDHFTGTTGTNLSGRALVIGGTWSAPAGTWTIETNQVLNNGVALGRLVTQTAYPNARVVLTVSDNGQGGRTSGLVMRSNAANTTFLTASTANGNGGRIYLKKVAAGVESTLVTISSAAFTNPSTFVAELNGASIKVVYNNVLKIDHTLTAADQATFGALGGYGLLNDNAATVRYDDFRVESL